MHITRSTEIKMSPEVTSLDFSSEATVASSTINVSKKVRTAIDLNFNFLI